MSSIDVFQEADGRWRWKYRDEKVSLTSNRTYGDEDAAKEAARIAYPDHFRSRHAASDRGFVHKLASVLTVALVVVVWRRRRAARR